MKKIIIAALFLAACGGSDPRPATGASCTTPDISQTCWLCSSQPACAWWATNDPQLAGCHDRDEQVPPDIHVVEVSDGCNALPAVQSR